MQSLSLKINEPLNFKVTTYILVLKDGLRLFELNLFSLHPSYHKLNRWFLLDKLKCLLQPIELSANANLLKAALPQARPSGII